jgi:competence protein ComER
MGGMLARSWVRTGALPAADLWLANRSPEKLQRLHEQLPGVHIGTPLELAQACRRLFLCTEGAEVPKVLEQVRTQLTPEHLVVLLQAPLRLTVMERRFPVRLAKLIPSVTQEALGGVALFVWGSRITEDDRDALESLLAPLGRTVSVPEDQLRICADLASAGPALLAYVFAAMARAARRVRPELPDGLAEMIVRETVVGTARLLGEAGMSADEITRRVAVPGGNTAAALAVLGQSLPPAWEQAFRATHQNEARMRAALGMDGER